MTDMRMFRDNEPDLADETDDDVDELEEIADLPLEVRDGLAISGSEPDPESDDDTLQNAQEVGIGLDADDDMPRPLNIAKDVEEAEKLHREQ